MTPTDALLLQGSVRMRPIVLAVAGALVCTLGLSPASANASNNDSKESQVQQKEKARRSAPQQENNAAKSPTDLESCKRDADGMKGPERSRFMTACLKERK